MERIEEKEEDNEERKRGEIREVRGGMKKKNEKRKSMEMKRMRKSKMIIIKMEWRSKRR